MKKFTSMLIGASLILSGILYGQDKKDSGKDEVKMPKSVSSILEDCKKSIISNRQEYDSKNMDVFSKNEKLLKIELEKITKSGKLEEAILVKSELEGLRGKITQEVDQMAKEGFKKDEKKEIGEKKSSGSVEKMFSEIEKKQIDDLVGKWLVIFSEGGEIEFFNNGKCSLNNKIEGIVFFKENNINIKWKNEQTYIITKTSTSGKLLVDTGTNKYYIKKK